LECPFDPQNCPAPPEELRTGSAYACGGLGALLLAALAISCLKAVPNLHYGIRYNHAQKYADVDNIYTAGRYFIGPWSSFVIFPAKVQNVEFSNTYGLAASGHRYPALHTRTKEGLALNLEVSLQYRLRLAEVGKLYTEFNVDFQDFFVSTIRDTLIKVAADYEAYQLWDQRKQVGDQMQSEVNAVLGRTYAECWGLQLLDIALPSAFDKSIVETQVQNQAISTEKFAQESAQIRAVTSVIESEYDRQIKVIRATGSANYTLITRRAKAAAKKLVLNTEAEILKKIREELQLTKEDLVSYQRYAAVSAMSNASLFYGFGDASQVLLEPPGLDKTWPGGRRLASDGGDSKSSHNNSCTTKATATE